MVKTATWVSRSLIAVFHGNGGGTESTDAKSPAIIGQCFA